MIQATVVLTDKPYAIIFPSSEREAAIVRIQFSNLLYTSDLADYLYIKLFDETWRKLSLFAQETFVNVSYVTECTCNICDSKITGREFVFCEDPLDTTYGEELVHEECRLSNDTNWAVDFSTEELFKTYESRFTFLKERT